MALLVGRHVNKIDKKGRVSVPKPFRDTFASEGFQGVYAYPSIRFDAIEVCGETYFRALTQRLDDQLSMFSPEQDDLLIAILDNAHALAFDPEGRIVIPAELLDMAAITDEARFVGRVSYFQIWQPDAHEEHRHQGFNQARARGVTLPPRQPKDGES
ncbi:MAG: division/cell wall cluster transcriptional repressor MraZ [Rhodospirillaceae bacterium]|nr:division/cell wall cluster transcriptional repressor MraZ [Rhodospirillaceae bacterium]